MKDRFKIELIENQKAKDIVIKYHYLHRTCPSKYSFGLFDQENNNELCGVVIYGNSASASLRKSVCGPEHFNNIYELTRLWIKEGLPTNTASFFISNTVKKLDKEIIVSYADPSVGHIGIIYQACNWIYTGLSTPFRDPVLLDNPNLHHTGFAKGLTNDEIKLKYGDKVVFKERVRKFRYVFFNCDNKRQKELKAQLKYKILPYPKQLPEKYLKIKDNEQLCRYCNIIKIKEEFPLITPSYKGKFYRRKKCDACWKEYRSTEEYKKRANDRRKNDEFRQKKREYRKLNSVKEKSREYEKTSLNKNPLRKVKKNLRNRLRIALKVKKWNKSTHLYEYIGCSQDELKKHLENKFQAGMTWENYGNWHVDHIVPLSLAKTEQEMLLLCHYTNLQPLWAKDNINKSNKTSL